MRRRRQTCPPHRHANAVVGQPAWNSLNASIRFTGNPAVPHSFCKPTSGAVMPLSATYSSGCEVKYARTDALASSGDCEIALLSVWSAPGCPARYWLAAVDTAPMVAVAPEAEQGAAPATGAAAIPAKTIPAPPSMAMPLNLILMFSFRLARWSALEFPVPEIQSTRANPCRSRIERRPSGANPCLPGHLGRVTHHGCEIA